MAERILAFAGLDTTADSRAALRETARVLRTGGRVFVLDKFLRRGEMAPLRRLFNPLMRRIATRIDVVFEDVLAGVPGLRVIDDQPVMAGGWFGMFVPTATPQAIIGVGKLKTQRHIIGSRRNRIHQINPGRPEITRSQGFTTANLRIAQPCSHAENGGDDQCHRQHNV